MVAPESRRQLASRIKAMMRARRKFKSAGGACAYGVKKACRWSVCKKKRGKQTAADRAVSARERVSAKRFYQRRGAGF